MPSSSSAYGAARLLKPDRSRWLTAWWIALSLELAWSLVLVCHRLGLSPVAPALLILLAAVAWRRRPGAPPLILYHPGNARGPGAWALPEAGLFALSLSGATQCGHYWVLLRFDHPATPRVLLLRDQLPASAWRQLRLSLTEPGSRPI